MSRLAQDGFNVLYVDTLGLRSPRLRDLPRISARLHNRFRSGAGGLRRTEEGVHVYSPLLLPFLNSRLVRSLNTCLLVPRLNHLLGQLQAEELIIWIYLPTWTVLQCIEHIPHRLLVYEAIDALDRNPAGVSRDYQQSELEILHRADLVLTTSESLYQQKKPHNPNTHWVPSGVEERFFAEVEPAAEVMQIQGPRIGFFGTLDHRLDLELTRELARAHRDWSFVLIGAARCDISALVAEVNIHFLGPKPHQELPRYLRGLDVLFLPYRLDEFTRHVYPAKIFECLSLGKPVVATALPSLEGLGEMVKLVPTPEKFARALQEALAEDNPRLREKRMAVARTNSWEARYRQVRKYLEDCLRD